MPIKMITRCKGCTRCDASDYRQILTCPLYIFCNSCIVRPMCRQDYDCSLLKEEVEKIKDRAAFERIAEKWKHELLKNMEQSLCIIPLSNNKNKDYSFPIPKGVNE